MTGDLKSVEQRRSIEPSEKEGTENNRAFKCFLNRTGSEPKSIELILNQTPNRKYLEMIFIEPSGFRFEKVSEPSIIEMTFWLLGL